MKTNFIMLKELIKNFTPKNKGFLEKDEVELIRNTLHLKEMDVLALRNMRDFAVLFLSKKESEEKDFRDILSGLTAIIDREIFDKGGEV